MFDKEDTPCLYLQLSTAENVGKRKSGDNQEGDEDEEGGSGKNERLDNLADTAS